MNLLQNILNFFNNLKVENIIDILIAITIIVVFKIISTPFATLFIRLFKIKEKNKAKLKQHALYKTLKNCILILGFYVATLVFNFPITIQAVIIKILKICLIVSIANGISNLFLPAIKNNKKLAEKLNINNSSTGINFINKIIKFLVYIIAGFIIIKELGYDLSGLVTGIGLSSVIIALAAQDIAKSLLGGICLFLDKPFNIGDFVQIGDYKGIVEDMTFRTTRIRSLNDELIVVPNSGITDNFIVNISKMNKRLFSLTTTLDLNTNLEKVALLNKKIEEMLNNNLHVLKDNIRVFFNNISDNGIDILIEFYIDITDYEEFLKFKNEMNYLILNIIEKENIELAYNSQTIYLKK